MTEEKDDVGCVWGFHNRNIRGSVVGVREYNHTQGLALSLRLVWSLIKHFDFTSVEE